MISGPIILLSRDLAAFGLTPTTFCNMPLSQQQLIAAQIEAAKGHRRVSDMLMRHNPNFVQFVVESDNVSQP